MKFFTSILATLALSATATLAAPTPQLGVGVGANQDLIDQMITALIEDIKNGNKCKDYESFNACYSFTNVVTCQPPAQAPGLQTCQTDAFGLCQEQFC